MIKYSSKPDFYDRLANSLLKLKHGWRIKNQTENIDVFTINVLILTLNVQGPN